MQSIFTPAIDWLNSSLLSIWGNQLTAAEVFGFSTGLIAVWLTVKKNVWNFPIGIINSALLLLLFWQARLFADSSLQVIFIALGFHGWWIWKYHSKTNALQIKSLDPKTFIISVTGSIVLIGIFAQLLMMAKGSVPIFDASITALSIVAQVLLNFKKLQTWLFWIAVDIISIPVYIHKELYLIAILYSVFLILAIQGYISWKKLYKVQIVN